MYTQIEVALVYRIWNLKTFQGSPHANFSKTDLKFRRAIDRFQRNIGLF